MARAFYECSSVEECRQLLERCPRSTSTAFTIADFDTLRCFESTVSGVAEVPLTEQGTIAHTNHLLASKDYRSIPGACEGERILKTPEGVSWEMTEERLALAEFNDQQAGIVTAEAVMEFLHTLPVLRNYGDPTLQSFVGVSCREEPHIYVSTGKGAGLDFVKVSL